MKADQYRVMAREQLMPSTSDRRAAVSSLLAEVAASRDVLENLQALKVLGRSQSGTEELATTAALKHLVHYAILQEDDSAAQLEAFRILCNTLKLHDQARASFIAIDAAVPALLRFLSSTTPPALQFVASRVVFLLTVKGSEINRTLIERHDVLSHLYDLFSAYTPDINIQLSTDQSMALSEHLKLVYNLAIFYPRLQAIDPKAASSPTTSTSSSSTAHSASDTGNTRTQTLGQTTSAMLGRGIRSVLAKVSSPNSNRPASPRSDQSRTLTTIKYLDQLAPCILQIVLSLPFQASSPIPQPPLSHALHALSELACTHEWFEPFDSIHQSIVLNDLSLPTTATGISLVDESLPPLVCRLLILLDSCLGVCFPRAVKPDDVANLKRLAQLTGSPPTTLDSELAPLLLLVRKCVVGDESGRSGSGLRARLLSDTIDRTVPLEERSDLTGRLTRLMSSVYFSHTKVGAGELLFALCGQDPADLARAIGYGPASGFLASNGLLVPPPDGYAQDFGASQPKRNVDPISGTYADPNAKRVDPSAGMTEEEKEREAEKLFVLFDRMAKTGVMSVENPLKKAQESGRFEELDISNQQEEIERSLQAAEDDEREAAAEMRKWRSRGKKA